MMIKSPSALLSNIRVPAFCKWARVHKTSEHATTLTSHAQERCTTSCILLHTERKVVLRARHQTLVSRAHVRVHKCTTEPISVMKPHGLRCMRAVGLKCLSARELAPKHISTVTTYVFHLGSYT
jgi:hypothetical protein